MNETLALQVLQEIINSGVREFCICPGARNGPFVYALEKLKDIKQYYWYEERSAAFFALGRSRLTNRPVAVITTSGTAAAEMLPAAMEAYYTGVPLMLITADRPRRFRGSGAPQTAEQVGLYNHYVQFTQDLENNELCDLSHWCQDRPIHLNICFEEPKPQANTFPQLIVKRNEKPKPAFSSKFNPHCPELDSFLQTVKHPLVVVSAVKTEAREALSLFLLELGAPIFLEGVSGLREDARLQSLRIAATERLWDKSVRAGYPIDGVLRIGGVPTFRLWRDLEELQGKVRVCSISESPFPGLSWSDVIHAPLAEFFSRCAPIKRFSSEISESWRKADRMEQEFLCGLFEKEPSAEPSLIYHLSRRLPINSNIYLGNSLPIREWDQAAVSEQRNYQVHASRGVNGIDGQISTFFGLCVPDRNNWAIVGDLTALYDMAGPWILSQLPDIKANLVVVNNGGGQIFSRMFSSPQFLHSHKLNFKPLAEMWGLYYERWTSIPDNVDSSKNRLIEIVPDNDATKRFWDAKMTRDASY